MKRILFIYRVNRNSPSNIGVIKKLKGQVDACVAMGHEVDYVTHDNEYLCLNQDRIDKKRNWNLSVVKFRFFYYLKSQMSIQKYDCIVIRYGLSNYHFIQFLKHIKHRNAKVKIAIDMPTYPYRKEYKGLMSRAVLLLDSLFQRQLNRYVDFVWHSGTEKELFSIPTLFFNNGVNENEIVLRNVAQGNRLSFRLFAMGKWQYWHGLDRLLLGIKKWKEKGLNIFNLRLDIAGDGPVISELKTLARALEIDDYITWHGVLSGERLTCLMSQADMGIGTLGLYRKGLHVDSSLKHRGYCAAGLPFVLSSSDADFPKTLSFIHYVPSDDSEINILELKSFYDNLDSKVSEQMFHHAQDNLSWKVKMRAILANMF